MEYQTTPHGDIRLGEELGRGGEAVVFAGSSVLDGSSVAVKVLRRPSREPAVLQSLPAHPNIIAAPKVQTCAHSGKTFLVFPRLKQDLFSVLEKEGPLSEAATKRVMRQLLSALHHLHSNDTSHSDVKHENLAFTEDGKVVLIDFGFARTPAVCRGRVGSHFFRSPESTRRNSAGQPTPFDGTRADVWAAGVVMSYCLSTFGIGVEMDAEGKDGRVVYPDPEIMSMYVSPAAKAFMDRMLVIDPVHRATAAELLADPWLSSESSDECKADGDVASADPVSTGFRLTLPAPATPPMRSMPAATMACPSSATLSPPTPSSDVLGRRRSFDLGKPCMRACTPADEEADGGVGQKKAGVFSRWWAAILRKCCGVEPDSLSCDGSQPESREPRSRRASLRVVPEVALPPVSAASSKYISTAAPPSHPEFHI